MQVIPSNFTVVEYCEQMSEGKIVVNRDYQRSNKVWPPAARSYLIDTILQGYPIPKLSLYSKTDLKSQKTIKEIVDGQQRSQAIYSFLNNEFRLSGNAILAGMTFSQLEEDDKTRFLNYSISVDIFVGASDHEIREVFRRINSYTVPLNPAEQRNALFQGEFKWFMVGLSQEYSQALKMIGTFKERQLVRMRDISLLGEVILSLFRGIESASEKKLSDFYRENDVEFLSVEEVRRKIDKGFERILQWEEIHQTALIKPYNFYSLIQAIIHHLEPVEAFMEDYSTTAQDDFSRDIVLANLGSLAAALDEPELYPQYADYVNACAAATTRIKQRKARFTFFCRALQTELM